MNFRILVNLKHFFKWCHAYCRKYHDITETSCDAMEPLSPRKFALKTLTLIWTLCDDKIHFLNCNNRNIYSEPLNEMWMQIHKLIIFINHLMQTFLYNLTNTKKGGYFNWNIYNCPIMRCYIQKTGGKKIKIHTL